MMVVYRAMLFIFLLLFIVSCTSESTTSQEINNTKDKNITFIKLLKVNNHTITSDILGPIKVQAFLYKFKKEERESIINQLINDEIAIQYTYKYMKLDDNITDDEKKRLNIGLFNIQNIALKESANFITDKNATSFYEKNKKSYWHEKHYEASHILVNDKNTSIKILDQLNRAIDVNATFKKLAKEFSTDRSSVDGGYLGHFESKVMVEPFKEALENLQIGKYTLSPVKTRFGYHIIVLHDIVPSGYIPFNKVKDKIKLIQARGSVAKWYEDILLPLKNKAIIEYLFDLNKTY